MLHSFIRENDMIIKQKQICIYILALLIILNHSVYYYIDTSKIFIQVFLLVWTFTTYMVITGWKTRIGKKIKKKLYLAIGLAIICLVAMNAEGEIVSFVSRYLYFIPLLILILDELKEEKLTLIYAISDIIFGIAVISLFFWLYGTFLDLIQPTNFLSIEWAGFCKGDIKGGYNYMYLYYEVQRAPETVIKYISCRNCAIFCEGPAYAFMLSLALVVENFFRQKKRISKIVILWLVMLTTLTSSTIMYMMVFMLLRWYLNNKGSRKTRTLIIPIMVLIFLFALWLVILNKSNQTSVAIRLGGYLGALKSLGNKPVAGYGYSYDPTIFGAGITDSLSDVAVRGGLLFIAYYLLPFISYIINAIWTMIKNKKNYNKSRDKIFALFVWGIYAFSTTILTYTFIMLVIVAYGYSSLGGDEESENKKIGDTIFVSK